MSYLGTADVLAVKQWCVVRGEEWEFTSELLKLKSSLLGHSNILKSVLAIKEKLNQLQEEHSPERSQSFLPKALRQKSGA